MVWVDPYDIERSTDEQTMHSAVLVPRDLELPSFLGSELFIQSGKTGGFCRVLKIDSMGLQGCGPIGSKLVYFYPAKIPQTNQKLLQIGMSATVGMEFRVA